MLYMQYLLDVIYLVVAAMTVIIFTKRGFVESVFRFGRTIFAGVITYFVGPHIGAIIYDKFIFDKIFDWVSVHLEDILVSTVEAVNVEGLIESLPFLVKQSIDKDEILAQYGLWIHNFHEKAGEFAASVSHPVASLISNLIAYTLAFLVSLLLLFAVFKILEAVFKLPLLKTVNRILGFLLGVVTAMLLLAAVTYVLSVLIGVFGSASSLSHMAESSDLFRFFNDGISHFDLF